RRRDRSSGFPSETRPSCRELRPSSDGGAILSRAGAAGASSRLEDAAGQEGADEVAARDGQQKVRGMVRVVVKGHVRGARPRDRALRDAVQEVRGWIVVRAANPERESLARLDQDPVRPDLDVELVYLARRERLAPGVLVMRLPRLRFRGVELALRAAKPAAGEQRLRAVGGDVPQGHEPQDFGVSGRAVNLE